jgi:hypothetical protein
MAGNYRLKKKNGGENNILCREIRKWRRNGVSKKKPVEAATYEEET